MNTLFGEANHHMYHTKNNKKLSASAIASGKSPKTSTQSLVSTGRPASIPSQLASVREDDESIADNVESEENMGFSVPVPTLAPEVNNRKASKQSLKITLNDRDVSKTASEKSINYEANDIF